MSAPGVAATDRVLTVPNVISIARLCCIPLFLWLLFADRLVAAGLLLGALGITDFVDGYLARRLGQVSQLGKLLDPLADRLLFLVCVPAILIAGAAPRWFCLLVILREALVALVALAVARQGVAGIQVSWWGKTGTFLLMVAFPWFVGGASDASAADLFQALGYLFGIPGLIISYYAAFAYLPSVRRSLRHPGEEPTR